MERNINNILEAFYRVGGIQNINITLPNSLMGEFDDMRSRLPHTENMVSVAGTNRLESDFGTINISFGDRLIVEEAHSGE